jgi:hypothetical protein
VFPKPLLLCLYLRILTNSGISLLFGSCNEIRECFLDKLGRICLEKSEDRLEIVITNWEGMKHLLGVNLAVVRQTTVDLEWIVDAWLLPWVANMTNVIEVGGADILFVFEIVGD